MFRENNHNHNHNYNLMGFDTIEINLVFQKIFGLKIILTQHSFKLKINRHGWMESFLLFLDLRFLDNSSSLG